MPSERSLIARTVRPPSSLGLEVAFSTSLNLEAAKNDSICGCVWIVCWEMWILGGPMEMVSGSA